VRRALIFVAAHCINSMNSDDNHGKDLSLSQQRQQQQQQQLLEQKIAVLLQATPWNHNSPSSSSSSCGQSKTTHISAHRSTSSRYGHEQRVVALLLLLRVSDDSVFQQVLGQNSSWIIRHLLQSPQTSPPPPPLPTNSEDTNIAPLSTGSPQLPIWKLRLVAQLLHRALSVSSLQTVAAATATATHETHHQDAQPKTSPESPSVPQMDDTIHLLGDALLRAYTSYFCNMWHCSMDQRGNGCENNTAAAAAAAAAHCDVLTSLIAWLDGVCSSCCSSSSSTMTINEALSTTIAASCQVVLPRLYAQIRDSSAPSATEFDQHSDKGESALSALLDQTSWSGNDDDDDTLSSHTTARCCCDDLYLVLLEQCSRCAVALASSSPPHATEPAHFMVGALSDWLDSGARRRPDTTPWRGNRHQSSTNESAIVRTRQAPALLAMIQGWARALASSTTSSPLQNTDAMIPFQNVRQLILATAAATHGNSLRLVKAAWTCTSTLMTNLGGAWLFSGRDTMDTGCAVLRLAVGEYRIQLGRILDDVDDDDDDDGAEHAAPRDSTTVAVEVIQATARVIVETTRYIERCLDSESGATTATVPWSGDVVRHVQRSLHEAMDTSVQYLVLSPELRRQSAVDAATIRVLAALWMELDSFTVPPLSSSLPFDDSTPAKRSNSSSSDPLEPFHTTALSALCVALCVAADCTDHGLQLRIELLPTLAAVMVQAASNDDDDDTDYGVVLHQHGVFGTGLVTFLQVYLDSVTTDLVSSVPWACQVLEQWMTMPVSLRASRAEIQRLKSSLLSFMQRMILPCQRTSSAAELANALSTTVGAFVALQGDEAPDMAEMHILQQVVLFCDEER
jgi:urease accessory protein UreF